jgi:hypothetical protein
MACLRASYAVCVLILSLDVLTTGSSTTGWELSRNLICCSSTRSEGGAFVRRSVKPEERAYRGMVLSVPRTGS